MKVALELLMHRGWKNCEQHDAKSLHWLLQIIGRCTDANDSVSEGSGGSEEYDRACIVYDNNILS